MASTICNLIVSESQFKIVIVYNLRFMLLDIMYTYKSFYNKYTYSITDDIFYKWTLDLVVLIN